SHGGGDLRDVAHLGGQVARHAVDVVGQVLPGAGHALDLRLAAELPLGADLAGHARHLRGEGAQLVHHGIDGVLQLQDLALDVHRDLLGQVAVGHGRGDLRDVAHLPGQVGRHAIDAVGQVSPGAGNVPHVGLAAELALGADLTAEARRVGGEGAERIDPGAGGGL